METPDQNRRAALIINYEALLPISKDEKLLGFHHQSDPYGGFVTYPLISDIQDEQLHDELVKQGLDPPDAKHITQAISNDCDVFLTRDESSIIKPHRKWLEMRFDGFRVRLPSELLLDLAALQ